MFELKYRFPATCFEEALPLGNGRIGGMVYGGVTKERISLNEDSFWSGYNKRNDKRDGYLSYEKAKKLTKEGKFHEAYDELDKNFLSDYSESYLPVGNLWIETKHNQPKKYYRSLDLESGIARIVYEYDNNMYIRKAYFSEIYDVMIYSFENCGDSTIDLKLSMDSPLSHKVKSIPNGIVMETEAPGHVRPRYGSSTEMDSESICYYEEIEKCGEIAITKVKVFTDGNVSRKGREYANLYVEDAKYVYIAVAINTTFNGREPMKLCNIQLDNILTNKEIDIKIAEKLHADDCSKLFNRSIFSLNGNMSQSYYVDDIIEQSKNEKNEDLNETHNILSQILYQWGRYLLIASSRPGTNAVNLQGIWNEDPRPIWSCNYTTNINLQMCYWPCMITGLSEMSEPYFRLIEELEEAGRETAWNYYRARGSVIHHNTDIWKITHPVGLGKQNAPTACYWNLAGGWFVKSIWDAYLFTKNVEFLKKFLNVIEGFVSFYCDIMDEEHGTFYMMPSTSPENRFLYPGGKSRSTSISKMSTMSVSIIREAFQIYIKVSNILNNIDVFGSGVLLDRVKFMVEKLPEYQIGTKGQLLEWEEEFEEEEKAHRHISHLYGLYPGNDIDWKNQTLCDAVKQSMNLRGNEGTGWSLAWKTGVWARLGDGNMAGKTLKRFMKVTSEIDANKSIDGGGICPNLFCNCPPMQIDGNFGIVAGIVEMILQSNEDEIRVLPAIPSSWKKGKLTGIGTRCGIVADIEWENIESGKKRIILFLTADKKQIVHVWIGKKEVLLNLAIGKNKFIF